MKHDVGLTHIVANFDDKSETYLLNKKAFATLMEAAVRSIPFDEEWYIAQYEDVRGAIEANHVETAHRHYIDHGFNECRLPYRVVVDESFYLERYKDVKVCVDEGTMPSAQWHFEMHGRSEGRLPYEGFSILAPVASTVEAKPAAASAATEPADESKLIVVDGAYLMPARRRRNERASRKAA